MLLLFVSKVRKERELKEEKEGRNVTLSCVHLRNERITAAAAAAAPKASSVASSPRTFLHHEESKRAHGRRTKRRRRKHKTKNRIFLSVITSKEERQEWTKKTK